MASERPYTILTVYVNLDPVPGIFNTPESAREAVESLLKRTIPHYNPQVYVSKDDVALGQLNASVTQTII